MIVIHEMLHAVGLGENPPHIEEKSRRASRSVAERDARVTCRLAGLRT